MEDYAERLRVADTKRSQVISARARDEVEVENATRSIAESKAALKDEFGIETTEDLKRVRSELEAELVSAISDVETSLAAAGG